MKKFLFISATLLAITGISQAQVAVAPAPENNQQSTASVKQPINGKKHKKEPRQLDRSEVSSMAKNNFMADFPGASNAAWTHGKYFDEVSFLQKGIALTAYYDYMSMLVGSTSVKTVNDLPAGAQKQLQKQWLAKGYTVDKVILFDDNEANETNMVLYNNAFDDQDNYFIELHNGTRAIILQSDMEGLLGFFKEVK